MTLQAKIVLRNTITNTVASKYVNDVCEFSQFVKQCVINESAFQHIRITVVHPYIGKFEGTVESALKILTGFKPNTYQVTPYRSSDFYGCAT